MHVSCLDYLMPIFITQCYLQQWKKCIKKCIHIYSAKFYFYAHSTLKFIVFLQYIAIVTLDCQEYLMNVQPCGYLYKQRWCKKIYNFCVSNEEKLDNDD